MVRPDRFTFHHFPELDGFRGVAILLVVAGHVLENDFRVMTGFGSLGVLLFFVLSGFLITGLLDRERQAAGTISLRAFYVRRVLRILPASMFYLLALTLFKVTGLVGETPWYSVAACLLFVRNIWGRGAGTGHLWSLSLEEQFYGVWPWIMSRLGSLGALRVAVIGATGVTAFRMLCIQNSWLAHGFTDTYGLRPWFRFDAILIGCAVALWLSRTGGRPALRRVAGSPLATLAVWPSLVLWTLVGGRISPLWHLTVQTLLALAVFLNLMLAREGWFKRGLGMGWLRWCGRLSYSWYLWQQLFTQFPVDSWSPLRRFPFNVGASLAAAALSYAVIETPFLRRKARIGLTLGSERFSHDASVPSTPAAVSSR